MEIFSNPTIIGAIIGALVGAIASATFAIIYEHVKFNKKKKGAYALIQSEINYMNDGIMLMRSPLFHSKNTNCNTIFVLCDI